MTIGTFGTLPASPLATGPDALFKQWSGSDGKYELYEGFLRQKWNNYTSDVVGNSVSYPYFRIFKYFILDPPGVGTFENVPVNWNNGTFNFDESQYYKPSYRPLSEALSDLLKQVKGHEFNLGVELGQAGQTVGLLAENLKKLGRAALALKRGDFAGAARCLGTSPRKNTRLKPSDISGRWLELQYGWLPLISSSYEACQAFAAIMDGPRKTIFRSSKRRVATWNLSTAPSTYSLICKGYVRTAIQYELYEEMSFTRQLGLEDPLSVAWELTPWSFVIDWFLPFGAYLSNLNQIPKLKGRWLITDTLKVEHQNVEAKYLNTNFGGPLWRGVILRSPEFRYWMTKTRRSYLSGPPEVPFPQFKFGLTTMRRFWNAVSLAHQRFQ